MMLLLTKNIAFSSNSYFATFLNQKASTFYNFRTDLPFFVERSTTRKVYSAMGLALDNKVNIIYRNQATVL